MKPINTGQLREANEVLQREEIVQALAACRAGQDAGEALIVLVIRLARRLNDQEGASK